MPEEIPFAEVNRVMKKKELGRLVDLAYRLAGNKATVIFADKLKDLGFEYATRAGHLDRHQGHGDPGREAGAARTRRAIEVREIEEQYNKGLITDGERYNKVVDIWAEVTDRIADEMMRELATETVDGRTAARSTASPASTRSS